VLAKGFVKQQDLELMTIIDDVDELIEAISYCRIDLEPGVKAMPANPPAPPQKSL
jgi:hypothetical protein